MAPPLPHTLLPDTAAVDTDGVLTVGGVAITDLIERHGSPLFVYDEAHLRVRCAEAVDAWGEGSVTYATKAFLCTEMARLAHEEGMHLDVATGGELFVALHAGVPGDRLVFHGNNKSEGELAMALDAGVHRVVVDSFDELDRLETLATAPVDVLVRITPGVEAHTHQFIATGQDDSKFGFTVSTGAADTAIRRVQGSSRLVFRGVHSHIGSQVFRLDSFAEAAGIVAAMVRDYDPEEVSLGGGLGVPYVSGEVAPTMREWADTTRRVFADAGLACRVTAEPGRAIVATAALTVYRVGTIKEIPGVRTYVAVDGGMSDNPRPVLYGSGYETFVPTRPEAERPRRVTVVGKHCESGDVLVRDADVPADLAVGDLIATPVTGAYGHSMGSNYNKVLRPAVVFVADGRERVVVRRETYQDLVRLDG